MNKDTEAKVMTRSITLAVDCNRLREINAELLTACKRSLQYIALVAADARAEGNRDLAEIVQSDHAMVNAAIARAEGEDR